VNGTRRPLHIVVTCANRKRHPVPAGLHLGAITQRRAADRFAAWTRRLDAATADRHPAIDSYAGEHWSVVRDLTTMPALSNARVWIASAGYGLIPADAAICAYSATFAAGVPDSVGASVAAVTEWWQRLGEWARPGPSHPRTFAQLADVDRTATVVAVLSEAYQRACAPDLLAAADRLGPDGLSVVGPPTGPAMLGDLLVAVTAVHRHTVGGSMQALNVRVAQRLLAAGRADRAALRQAAAAAAPVSPPAARAAGLRLSDGEVVAFIRGHAHTSATQLLRQLRTTGRSCEQHRFADLHRAACEVHR
jgi:hypothetical protein